MEKTNIEIVTDGYEITSILDGQYDGVKEHFVRQNVDYVTTHCPEYAKPLANIQSELADLGLTGNKVIDASNIMQKLDSGKQITYPIRVTIYDAAGSVSNVVQFIPGTGKFQKVPFEPGGGNTFIFTLSYTLQAHDGYIDKKTNMLESVTTEIDAWNPYDNNETGDETKIAILSKVYSHTAGISGWGINTIRGYELDGEIVEDNAGEPEIINKEDIICCRRSCFTIKKGHTQKNIRAFVKSVGQQVGGVRNVAPFQHPNEVSLELTIPQKTNYPVIYNATGGTGAPQQQTKWYNETLILSDVVPTRDKYVFQGWATSEGGTSVAYAPGASYTENSNLNLYAIWKGKPHVVRYNANGGTGAPEDQLKEYEVALTLSSTRPTREGYNFMGWATSAEGEISEYNPGDTYTKDEDVTLYAVWKAITYDVIYNANGGTGAPEAQKKIHTDPLVLSNVKPTRDGHDFLGWGISAEDTTVDYSPGASYSNNEDITLYAIWKIHTYHVKYDANGGTGAPENQTKVYNQDLALSSTQPTREGYNFMGWATSAEGEVSYSPGDTYTSNSAVTLYAIWKIIVYTITYNANGGHGAPENQTKEYGTTITLSYAKPNKHRHEFLGWSTSSDGDVEYTIGSVYTANANLTLYAVWRKVPLMKVLNGYEICDGATRERLNGIVTSGSGDAYVADVWAIDTLKAGASFTMIPHITATSMAPTLNVNNFGAKPIKQRISSSSSGSVNMTSSNMLSKDMPVIVVYDGASWLIDIPAPDAGNLYGTVPIESGGTGAVDAANARKNLGVNLNNLGITWGTADAPAKGTPNSIYIQIN